MAYPFSQDDFITFTIDRIKIIKPEAQVHVMSSDTILIDGRRFNITNLYKIVQSCEEVNYQDVVDSYMGNILSNFAEEFEDMDVDTVLSKLMPRIQPISIFDELRKDNVAHVPFVNDTAIIIVVDFPDMTMSVTSDQLDNLGIDVYEAEEIARNNLLKLRNKPEIIESKCGSLSIIFSERDGYDSSRLLLPSLYDFLYRHLEGNFYVAIPSRDMFIALPEELINFREEVRERIKKDYEKMPHPISTSYFYVTKDGIVGEEPWDERSKQ